MMVVWPHNGRPVAMASIYPWDGKMVHEFDSFRRGQADRSREGPRVLVARDCRGWNSRTCRRLPKPAKTAAERLRQMKTIAEGFQATMTGWAANDSDQEVLRSCRGRCTATTSPERRIPTPSSSTGHLFAFVQGTDPEVVMALEAIGTRRTRSGSTPAFATSGGLEVKQGDAVVWTATKHPAGKDPKPPTSQSGECSRSKTAIHTFPKRGGFHDAPSESYSSESI